MNGVVVVEMKQKGGQTQQTCVNDGIVFRPIVRNGRIISEATL